MLDVALDPGEEPAIRAAALRALQRMLERHTVSQAGAAISPVNGGAEQGNSCEESGAFFDVAELFARREFWRWLPEVSLFQALRRRQRFFV